MNQSPKTFLTSGFNHDFDLESLRFVTKFLSPSVLLTPEHVPFFTYLL